jgi:uncharacterized protein (DUF697 family)
MSETEQITVKSDKEKSDEALVIVRRYVWWSLGAGLVPVPFVDMIVIAGIQLKMISEISKVYGVEFSASRGQAIVGSLIGSIFPEFMATVVATFLKTVPGGIAGGTMVFFSGAAAWALGKVFIQHFESGGTFLNFEPGQVREYFREQFEEGRKITSTMNRERKTQVPA